MNRLKTLLGGAALLLSSASLSHGLDGVVVSIKPIHSLVAGVMTGVGEPEVIVDGASSPHAYSLKPSQARAMQNAKVVFWVGESLETFLIKPIDTLSKDAKIVELADTPNLKKIEFREGGAFEGHGHHDDHGDEMSETHEEEHAHASEHDHDKEHDHEKGHGHDDDHSGEKSAAHEDKHEHDHDKGHGHDDDHGGEKSAAHEDKHDHASEHDDDKHDGHDDEHGHGDHAGFDPHIWLDPENAKVMVGEIKNALSEIDPSNAALYASNAEAVVARLGDLSDTVATELGPVKSKPFVVFHDAYHYFEDRFGLEAAGSLTVNPDVAPGAARISELRDKLNELGATCVFSEPQFSASIVEVLTEETEAASAVLDPLGAGIEKGPDLYFELMTRMARSFKDCLAS